MGERLDHHLAALVDQTQHRDDQLGFMVAGYENESPVAFELKLPSRVVAEIFTDSGCEWRGQTQVIERLIVGVDPRLPEVLSGLDCRSEVRIRLKNLEYKIPNSELKLQDAVDLAYLAVRTTIDVQRLTRDPASDPGSCPAVGGQIAVAVATPRGVQWMQG